LREKTFVNFEVLWLFAKIFSTKFGVFGNTSKHFAKVFPVKILLSTNSQSFPVYHGDLVPD